MTKLGPLIAIVSGLLLTIFAGVSLWAVIENTSAPEWVSGFDKNKGDWGNLKPQVIYGIIICIGALEMILGMFTWSNPKGFSSFILMGLFTAHAVMLIIAGTQHHNWPKMTIVQIVLAGLSALGILFGWLKS